MIGRLIRAEVAGLRRSLVVWLAVLLVVGGSVLARTVTWISHALGRTELRGLPFVHADIGWSDVALPLALLAYLIMTAYVFGRDFEDGGIDLLLTAPVRREWLVVARTVVVASAVLVLSLMGWGADVAMRAALTASAFDPGQVSAASSAVGSAMAAVATLPLVAWASVRFRGVLPALGLGIAIQVGVLALGGIALVRLLPWFLPMTLAAGHGVSWLGVALSALLFAGGVAATLQSLRTVDLYE
jgi:ABC-2 type transport system permease protein